MKQKLFTFLSCCILQPVISIPGYAQKVSEILENGKVVKNKHAIFLQLNGEKVSFEIGKQNSDNFDPLGDNFFLLHGEGANIYLAPPLNPLNFSSTTEVKFTDDEINKTAGEALGKIMESLIKLQPPTPAPDSLLGKPVVVVAAPDPCIKLFQKIRTTLEEIEAGLSVNKKGDITTLFKSLKDLDFIDKAVVESAANPEKYASLETYYVDLGKKVNAVQKDMNDYFKKCDLSDQDIVVQTYVLNQILKEESAILQSYINAIKELKKAFEMINKVVKKSEGEGKEWRYKLGRVSMEENKIATYTVTFSSDEYSLSEENKLSKGTQKTIATAKLRFRKFQPFVPEVSIGIAYTYLTFPKYDLEENKATGDQVIVRLKDEEFKRVNFNTMINLNYYIPNSIVHPFWQIGVGVSADYPTVFTGIGGRIRIGNRRFAISTGFAASWIKTLNTLNVGDVVSGKDELEKDITYEFSLPLKPYIGMQFNF